MAVNSKYNRQDQLQSPPRGTSTKRDPMDSGAALQSPPHGTPPKRGPMDSGAALQSPPHSAPAKRDPMNSGAVGATSSNQMLEMLMNRAAHSYDAKNDPAAQAARKEAARNADAVTRNTMGQHAAMTGGVASTAAVSAAAQAGNAAMAQGADKIADLEQLSWQRYQQEGQNMAQLYDMIRGQEQDALANERYEREWQYQKDRDAVADRRYDQEWAYQQGRDQIADQRYNQEWAYQQSRDQIADQRYDQEWAYQQSRDQVADQRYNQEWAYQQGRDKIADQRYDQEWAYQQSRDQVEDKRYDQEWTYQQQQDSYDQKLAMAQLAAAYGDYSGLKALGVNIAAYTAGGSGGGGSSGGSSRSSGSSSKGSGSSSKGSGSSGGGLSSSVKNDLKYQYGTSIPAGVWSQLVAQYGEAALTAAGFRKKTSSSGNTGGQAQTQNPGKPVNNQINMMY